MQINHTWIISMDSVDKTNAYLLSTRWRYVYSHVVKIMLQMCFMVNASDIKLSSYTLLNISIVIFLTNLNNDVNWLMVC